MAKQAAAPGPRAAPRPARPESGARPIRAARRRWGRRLAGTLGLLLAGLLGYNLFLVYRFEHAIYHPLQAPVPTLVPRALSAPPTSSTRGAGASHVLAPPPVLTVTASPLPPALPARGRAPLPPTVGPAATPVGRINILLLGTDQRPEDAASRSDTLIILSLDPQWKTLGILSVPRDLQVRIPGYGLQKINAAYFFGQYDHLPGGGPSLALTTVSQFFAVPLAYYVAINFNGFQQVIDMLGGIDLYVPVAIDDPLYPGPNNSYLAVHFDAGCQHLDGVRALEYARTRHADSDFGRNRRQQQVIAAVRARVLQLDVLPHYAALLGQVGDSLATNIPPAQQWAFAQLAGQIASADVYTAQIDNTLVSMMPGSSNLALNWEAAQPLLDWFFGQGPYAGLKPGTRPTPLPGTPTSTPEAVAPPGGPCP